MKRLVALSLLLSSVAFAGTSSGTGPTGATATAQQQQQQRTDVASTSTASNAGNAQSIIFNSATPEKQIVESRGTTTVKNVPSVGGPALTSSNDTCMGSLSGSVNVAGFGGSLGSTFTDKNCVMLKNVRELWNMGFRAAALARMCQDGDNREALEITGFHCPTRENAVQATTSETK